jgi:hypothetical protein
MHESSVLGKLSSERKKEAQNEENEKTKKKSGEDDAHK